MALVEMKRVNLLAMASDRDKLLRILQRAGCVEITEVEGDGVQEYLTKDRAALEAADEKLTRIRWTLGQLGRFGPKEGMLSQMSIPEVTEAEAAQVAGDEAALMAIVDRTEQCERRSGELRGAEARIRVELDQMLPWRGLSVPVEKLKDSRDTIQLVGTVSKRSLAALESAAAGLPVRMESVAETGDSVCIWVLAHKSVRDAVMDALKAADFSSVQFARPTGTPAEQIDGLHQRLVALDKDRAEITEELRSMASELPRLKLLFEVISGDRAREAAGMRFARTGSTFLMQGWVPGHACERLEKRLRAVTKDIAIEFRSAADDETPPTLLHNNRIAAPFEAVISNYSLPDPRGFDPTFIMMPFFVCFFGMMVSDAGYGLVMAILIPLVIHFAKPKSGLRRIMWILAIGGIGTVFWGAMYDGWFGTSLKPMLLNPLEQPLEMMLLCMGVGAVHLLTGLGVAVYMNFKRGKPLDALFDQFSWLMILGGIGMLLIPGLSKAGMVLALVGVVIVVCTGGRDKETLPKKVISGLGKLYDITSWLSDLLSYMRLFGMGLATGVIALVFNTLAAMLMGGGVIGIVFGVLLLIVGHTFNMAINVLGAYVHACRLQYIEFFGKFYEDGGRPFVPLAPNPRYVAIRESDAGGVEQ